MEQGLCRRALFSNALKLNNLFMEKELSLRVGSSLKDTGPAEKVTGSCFDYFQEPQSILLHGVVVEHDIGGSFADLLSEGIEILNLARRGISQLDFPCTSY